MSNNPNGETRMPADLARYRDRLKASRRHLVERLAEEDDPNREIPDLEDGRWG